MATNGSFAQQDQHKAAADQFSTSSDNSNLAKDEVGWYFVEQYYTTLSKSPEKLHLFYSKRSQFVYGQEAEVANVAVGRQAIQERIKALDFQDCKVRVSNVDSQASDESIVIQVIGETSNKGAEPRKFVQTFVLAQQPSGYFVLNDMLRYIDEEDDTEADEAEEEAPAPAVADAPEAAPEPVVEAAPVEQKLISEVAEKATANGKHTEAEAKVEAPAVPAVEPAAEEAAEEELKEEEKPKEPAPTPAKVETPAPKPTGPPKPMTWASRAAAAAGPRPVVPLPKTATPPATNESRAPAPAPAPAAAAPAPAAAPAAAASAAAEPAPKEASGWQTAGADSKRQNRPQSTATAGAEKEGTMGYVKYVTEKVQDADLRAALAAHGELSYFDINRQKNCAFVEYKTLEGYQAAVSSNPHTVNGENIVVEPRRPKTAGHNGGASFGAGRGSGAPRGRGGFEGNRNGGQGNARGNFGGQSRGRGGAARGRGGAQAANNA
ncbi:hypothetical protein PWT90_04257 [Aphanocladium album]|nr:hypothetical protein PWT90_04257 [Aphanocladium album]